MRIASSLLLITFLLLAGGCATIGRGKPAYTATATAKMDPNLQAAVARREAIQMAEVRARDQIMLQALQMTTPDGRTLEQLAVEEPFVQAMLLDTIRVARVSDRIVSPEGQVSVTVSLDEAPLQKILTEFQQAQAR